MALAYSKFQENLVVETVAEFKLQIPLARVLQTPVCRQAGGE